MKKAQFKALQFICISHLISVWGGQAGLPTYHPVTHFQHALFIRKQGRGRERKRERGEREETEREERGGERKIEREERGERGGEREKKNNNISTQNIP